MKKWLVSLVIIIAFSGGSIYYLHLNKKNNPKDTFVVVKKDSIVEIAQAIGYIKPRHSITVKSQINGIVSKLYHNEGEYV